MLVPGYYKITIGTFTSSEVNVVALATSAAFETTISITAYINDATFQQTIKTQIQ